MLINESIKKAPKSAKNSIHWKRELNHPSPQTDSKNWISDAVAAHERSLVRYCQRLVGNIEIAHEIVQESFVKLCRQEKPLVDDHLKCWLFKVTRNQAIDWLRRNQKVKSTTIEPTALPDREAPPDEQAETKEIASKMMQLVSKLPDNHQEVLRLKFQNGMSYREISEVTELSVTNVGFILHQAIQTLRSQI